MGYYFAPHTIARSEAVWEALYSRDPACYDPTSRTNCLWNLPPEQHHLFLGVEACAWGVPVAAAWHPGGGVLRRPSGALEVAAVPGLVAQARGGVVAGRGK